jgi:hypothetical protein
LHTEANGLASGIGTAADTQFRQHGRHVVVDSLWRQHQLSGDVGVAQTLGDESQHVELA